MLGRAFKSAAMVLGLGLGLAAALWAAQPGERSKGPEFKCDNFTLVWGKLKANSEVELGNEAKSKFNLQLDGSLDVPADLDAVAVLKKLRIRTVNDTKGADMAVRAGPGATPSANLAFGSYSAIHNNVGQVELLRTELAKDPTQIGLLTLETDVVIAKKRAESKLPPVVMEDFKEVGQGVSVRIRTLAMSHNRDLTVTMDYKRLDSGPMTPFIEAVYAVDAAGKDLGGGRWTEGDPMGKTGSFTAKFSVPGQQVHSTFRVVIVTASDIKRLTFEVKDMFDRGHPAKVGAGPGGAGGRPTSGAGAIDLPP